MTKSQEQALNTIKKLTEKHMKGCYNNAEFKMWEVHENEYFVSVVLEVGEIGDEGTMAAIFGRDHAQLFIGKRGKITYPVSKTFKNGKTKHYTKEFEGITILQVICDQR